LVEFRAIGLATRRWSPSTPSHERLAADAIVDVAATRMSATATEQSRRSYHARTTGVVRFRQRAGAVPPLDPWLLRLSGGNVAAGVARPLQG
jgi:hypothetical protein